MKTGDALTAEAFADGYRKARLKGACTAAIELLKNRSRTAYVSPFAVATYYAVMGDREHAFEWLERSYQQHAVRMAYIKSDPLLDALRSDPRYVDLLRRMGLPQ